MAWSDGLVRGTPTYAIAASQNPQIRVMAGPGTGKSFALKRRVARLLQAGISPEQILPITFTRVAAEDLHRELVGMQIAGCEELRGTTIHSLALRILMRNHVLRTTGRTPRPLNEYEVRVLEADHGDDYGGIRAVRKKIKAYEASWARLQRDEPQFRLNPDDQRFSDDLVAWLVFHRSMLIGEVIPQLHQYLSSNPGALERTEYSHVLVDEYQDLNKAEQRVIDLMTDNAEICIVGDDDQSIYSFRYAHPEGIREWLDYHEEADDLGLIECRRCPTRIVNMANDLIHHNCDRPVVRELLPVEENGEGIVRIIQYPTSDAEARGIADSISNMIDNGTRPGDILVLAQRRVVGNPIYEQLRARDIPVKSYYVEAELSVEDAQRRFATLKLFVDRDDRVALRWLLGYGSQNWRAPSYRRVQNHCDENRSSPWDALEQLSSNRIRLPHTSSLVERFEEIRANLEMLEQMESLSDVVDELFPENAPEVRDLRQLALNALELVEEDDREQFMSELVAAITQPDIPSEIQDVRIMSLHKSKGLSSPVTIIAGCVEGLLPKQPDPELSRAERNAMLEEQRRLFYVGITRTKVDRQRAEPGTLILTYSQQMPLQLARAAGIDPANVRGRSAFLHASRFINEMRQHAPRPVRP